VGIAATGTVYSAVNTSLAVMSAFTAIALIATSVVMGIGPVYCVLALLGTLPLVV
jgi:hypothetical protein